MFSFTFLLCFSFFFLFFRSFECFCISCENGNFLICDEIQLKGIPMRAYAPQMQNNLFDDDPGIMSEVETASTGFRRGGKQRSSLPVVRTPSKTLERPLGEIC